MKGEIKMRNIKFRAWDKWEKRMIKPHNGDFIKWHAMSNWKDCLEVMQYTGLKDKNDTEIYDGDIVQLANGVKQKVYWENEIFAWNVERFSRNGRVNYIMLYELRDITTFEVIGNIYEHPELLG